VGRQVQVAISGGILTTGLASQLDWAGSSAASSANQGALAEARAWLARELHDGAVQHLTVMVVELEHLKRASAPAALERLQATTRSALDELRRLLYELRDEPTMETGFTEAIRERLEQLATVSGIEADLVIHTWPDELPSHQAWHLSRIASEALANVRRHSGATRVTVTLQVVGSSLAITITDNGRGLGSPESGFGLRGMRERAHLLDGRITLNTPPAGGTRVRCIVPFGESQ
jgi:two-component system sensor histidine kinase UhpB